ncbi:MAG: spore germination protein [Sporomusa sp.]|nr:spore germination protein [Sporomusa sp.]
MGNIRKEDKMSPWQFAIILTLLGFGASVITASNKLVPFAGLTTWLAVLVAGGVYFGVAYFMIIFANMFPRETIVIYSQRIWGRPIAIAFIWMMIIIFMIEIIIKIQIFSREITFFMFDRTPHEVIILTMLAVCGYCALQDLGTLIRVSHIIFFTAVPMMMGIILLGYINFQFINIYPLWPKDIYGMVQAVLNCWVFFFGYEFILLLLPYVYKGNTSVVKAIGVSFIVKAVAMAVSILMTVGSLTVEAVKAIPYPTLVAIRSVELPGTFVERLDNYVFIAWIPLIFTTGSLFLFLAATAAAELHRYSDHRPFVFLFIPVLFIGSTGMHDLPAFEFVARNVHWLGLFFSFGVIPATYLMARWQRHKKVVRAG